MAGGLELLSPKLRKTMSINLAAQTKPKTSSLMGAGLTVAIALAAVTVGVGGYWAYTSAFRSNTVGMANDRLFTVVPSRLDVVVSQMGELQAVDNIELISRVEGRATITDIVKEGAYVNKDDILVQLDSSAIRQNIDDLSLEIQRQDAAVANAREMLAIQQSNNAAELEGAIVSLQLAEVDLQKYIEGTFPQESKSAATKLEMAKIDLQNKQDDLAQAKSLFTRGFVTAADVKKSELAVTQARNSVDEAETALRVLSDYTHRADMAAKQNAVAQAKSKLERVKRQNESMLVQKTADLNSAEQQLSMRQRRMELLKTQLEACTIRAPEAGMVVYSNSNDNDVIVKEGAEVRERQPIIRLPDTRNMKVVLKLNESQANRVQMGMNATVSVTGLDEPLIGTVGKVSIVPISGNRWTNPDAKDYPAEIMLSKTPDNLKPSTSARATIMIRSLEEALTVRLEAIYAVGNRAYVFVPNGESFEPREVKVGDSSMTHAAITSGLKAGERVLVLEAGEGKRLLESAGIKIEPATQPSGPRGNGGAAPNGAGAGGPAAGGPGGMPAGMPGRNRDAAGGMPGANASPAGTEAGNNGEGGERRRRNNGGMNGGPGGGNNGANGTPANGPGRGGRDGGPREGASPGATPTPTSAIDKPAIPASTPTPTPTH